MYLEIDEGYWEHPKTLDLCARLKDSRADTYPPRLWKWAARSAKTGKLGNLSPFSLEKAVHYDPMDGKCAAALIESGFIDKNEDGTLEIHDWMDYTGGAVKRMEGKAKENRKRRTEAKKRREEESYRNRTGTIPVQNPTRTDQDKTRQVQSSPVKSVEREGEPTPPEVPPANEPGKPTPYNVVAQYLAIRLEVVVGKVHGSDKGGVFQQPQPGDIAKASGWLTAMSPEDCGDIEPAIRLACEHVRDGVPGWNKPEMAKVGYLFGSIVRSWPDLLEELHNCAPKLAPQRKPGEPERRDLPVVA